jgi:hypothetical protein
MVYQPVEFFNRPRDLRFPTDFMVWVRPQAAASDRCRDSLERRMRLFDSATWMVAVRYSKAELARVQLDWHLSTQQ